MHDFFTQLSHFCKKYLYIYHTFVNLIKNSTIFGKVLIHFRPGSFITRKPPGSEKHCRPGSFITRKPPGSEKHLHLYDILSCLDILFNYYFLTFISSNICCFNLPTSVKNTLIPLSFNFNKFLNLDNISFCRSVPILAGFPSIV